MGVKNLLSDIARPLVSECSPDLAFCLVFYLDKKYIKFSTKSSANDLFIKLFSSYTRCHVQNVLRTDELNARLVKYQTKLKVRLEQ